MSIRHYTAAQLHALRDSPLVVKPDNLPAIEQWIDEPATHNHASSNNSKRDGDNARGARVQKTGLGSLMGAGLGSESSPMGSFSTGRPTLSTRMSSVRANGEDISLGPPRTSFPSASRNATKQSELQERTPAAGDAVNPSDEHDNPRSKFFSDRQLNRRSLNNDKEGAKESWTTVRDRREAGRDREDRFGRHDKDEGDRRNGFGERHDPRWSNNRDDRRNGEGRGGWRDREQQRRDRDGDRGHNEREPEWMDDPMMKKDQELGFTARTQEDFQKWKDSMSKKTRTEPEREEPAVELPSVDAAPAVPENKPAVAPLRLDGFDNGFGNWATTGSAGANSATTPGTSTTAASKASAKPKASRFASMFSKPAAEEVAHVEETPIQKAANGVAKTSAEDQEGFNRVLQMLGSTKIEPPAASPLDQPPTSPPPATKSGSNGVAAKPKSRFTDMFAQKDPERLQSPQQGGILLGGDVVSGRDGPPVGEEPLSIFNGRQPERQASEPQVAQVQAQHKTPTMSPAPGGIPFNALREQQPRPQSGRMNDVMYDPPSRGPPTPDVNIQNLLAQQRQRPQHTSNESQQLLNLLRKDTSNSRPPSQQAAPSNGGVDQAQVQQWLEQQQRAALVPEPHAPKPRVPQQAPGLFEEQLMRNYPMDQQRQELAGMPESQQRRVQHPPPGLPNDQQIFLHHHQHQQQQQIMGRRYNDVPSQQQPMAGPGRRMSGHPNVPQMQIPHQVQQYGNDYHHITSPGGQTMPPPGFGPRHGAPAFPPNFYQPPPQQRDGPPPGLNNNIQSLPPGHFGAPQGMPQYMMRSPTDGMPPPGLRGNLGRGFDPYENLGARR